MSMFVESNFPPHPRCYGSKCSKCGRAAVGEPVLNTGMELDHADGLYGTLYLCRSCVYDMGRKFNMLSPEQVVDLTTHLDRYFAEIDALKASLTHYEHLQALIDDGEAARRAREEAQAAEAARLAEIEAKEAAELPAGFVKVVPPGKRRS